MINRSITEYIAMCEWDPAKFLIFSDNVFGNLVYYSHLLPLVVSLLFALFVFFKNSKLLSTKWLLLTVVFLSVWLFSDLVLWATEQPSLTMFFWSMLVLIEPFIFAGMLFFVHAFIDGKDVSFKKKLIIFALLLPTVVLTPTSFALVEYDLSNCWREAIEGPLAFYGYAVEILFSLWILVFGIKKFFEKKDSDERRKVVLVTIGTVFFLIAFAMGNVIGSLLVNWEIGQYGLFGIPIFVAMLSYLVVKYNVFNIRLIGAQVLVFALGLLVLGMMFVRSVESVRTIALVTLVLIAVAGHLLIKGVRKEIRQKEELAKLNVNLKDVIQQRESLVHLITHKVKGSFTRTKYIFAEMISGSFGDITSETRKMAEKGLESDETGIQTIDLVLNASNLESGIVKYDMKKIDLRGIVEGAVSEKTISAEAKGLKLETHFPDEVFPVFGDSFWLKEVAANLVDNSIKYTKEGEVKVSLEKKDGKALLIIKDTGVGIAEEDKKNLFTEGGRGKESMKMNVDATGYGLFSVKLIVDAHGGRVWAESEGVGKGSTFFVELDTV